MPTPAPFRTPPPRERGFVLVGVVMFVLALTILGLSLFSLSSFEAQFLGRSAHDSQAFHYAAGGLERAKFVLAQTGNLGKVGEGISAATPLEGVVYASAVQNGDSTGLVHWSPDLPITITVRARDHDVERALQANYMPNVVWNPYKYLLATHQPSGAVWVQASGGSPATDRNRSVNLDGRVWQNDHGSPNGLGTAGYTTLLEAFPSGGVKLDSVPELDVRGFITEHALLATPLSGAGVLWQLHATGVSYFKTDEAGAFSLRVGSDATISVRDTAVWLFPRGVRFDGMVSVTAASPGACLIIVANHNGTYVDPYDHLPYFETAAWFFGGLQSTSVPVIIATQDEVRLEQFNRSDVSTGVGYLSMYAGFAFLMGPQATPGYRMRLHHAVPYENDYLIDRLVAQGALPGSEVLTPGRFKLAAGSWQEIGR